MPVYDDQKNDSDELEQAYNDSQTEHPLGGKETHAYSSDDLRAAEEKPMGVTPEKDERDGLPDLRSDAGLVGSGAPDLAAQGRDERKRLGKYEKAVPDTDLRDLVGNGYTPDGKKKGKFKTKLRKKLFIGGAVAGLGGLIGMVVLLLLLASSLKLPDASEAINFELIRMSRQLPRFADKNAEESLAAQAAEADEAPNGKFASVKEGWNKLRDNTWGKLDKYRVDKQIENVLGGQDHNLKLQYRTSKLNGREILTGMNIDGVQYDMAQATTLQKWTPVLNDYVKGLNKLDFAKVAFPALNQAMRASDIGPIMRFRIANQLRQEMGIHLIAWTLQSFENKDAKTARLEEAKQKYKAIQQAEEAATGSEVTQAATDEINKASEAAAEAQDGTVADPVKLQAAIDNNGIAADAIKAADDNLKPSPVKEVIGQFTGLDALLSLCIINDMSITQSGPTINANVAQQEAAYYYINSAADQQKAGSPDNDPVKATALANAIQATADDAGDITKSNPIMRASGASVDTSDGISAEAGSGGSYDFSILNALGDISPSSTTGKIINTVINGGCQAATSDEATAIAFFGGVAASIGSFGGTEAGLEAAQQGAQAFIKAYIQTMVKNLFGKVVVKDGVKEVEKGFTARAKNYIAKQVAVIGGTVGLGEIAHLVTANRAGEINSGLNQGPDLLNAADSGGNLVGNQLEQTQLFGRPLTQTEEDQSNQEDHQFVYAQTQAESPFQRYLATSNANSLLSRMAISLSGQMNTSLFRSVLNLGSIILSPLQSLGHLAIMVSGATQAASNNTDYKNVQIGWSQDEEKLIDSNTSYYMLENQAILDQSGQEDAIASKYANCFGYTYNPSGASLDPTDDNSKLQLAATKEGSIGSLLASGAIPRDNQGALKSSGGLCAPDQLGSTNSTFGDLVFRWRLAMSYDTTLNQEVGLQSVTK